MIYFFPVINVTLFVFVIFNRNFAYAPSPVAMMLKFLALIGNAFRPDGQFVHSMMYTPSGEDPGDGSVHEIVAAYDVMLDTLTLVGAPGGSV